MPQRTRSRAGPPSPSGTINDSLLNTTFFRGGIQTTTDAITDVVGSYPGDNPMTLYHRAIWCDGMKGSNARFKWNNAIPTWYNRIPAALGGLGARVDGTANTVLARSNPSRPVVDLPVFVAELGDLPKLVQVAGRTLIEKIAHGNLALQFGWKPLISDVNKMLAFTDHVAKRQAELQRLYDKGGLKRRIKLGSDTVRSSFSNLTTESVAGSLVSKGTISHTVERWGTVKWRPTTLPLFNTPGSYSQSVRAVLGLDLTMSTIWEMIPFSWMADWFSDCGDFLMAHRNTVPAAHGAICLMTHDLREETHSAQSRTAGMTWGGATLRDESKTRTVTFAPVISGSLPFLSMGQLSILGSLSVLHGGGRSRG
jgi:hypothetical protein